MRDVIGYGRVLLIWSALYFRKEHSCEPPSHWGYSQTLKGADNNVRKRVKRRLLWPLRDKCGRILAISFRVI
jgi:hypothetical protein